MTVFGVSRERRARNDVSPGNNTSANTHDTPIKITSVGDYHKGILKETFVRCEIYYGLLIMVLPLRC